MTGIAGIEELTRLEDFIRLAKEGKDVLVKIDLRKLTVKQKVHPQETEGPPVRYRLLSPCRRIHLHS